MTERHPAKPDVTIVIPVFNGETYLQACLSSVVRQTLDAIEIICVDDGSSDRTAEILAQAKKEDGRIRVIRNERNRGAAHARNRGIEAARGRFIRFVDADDLLPADSTERLHRRAAETGSDAVRGSITLFRGRPSRILSSVEVPDRVKSSLKDEPTLWIPWWHTSYLISITLIRGNEISYPLLRRGEDPVFIANVLVHAGQISLLPDVVYHYRKFRKSSGSNATTFEDVMDYLKHVSMVKSLYDAVDSACWANGYGPFVRRDLSELVAKSQLTTEQLFAVTNEANKTWNGVSFRRRRFGLRALKRELAGIDPGLRPVRAEKKG